MYVAFELQTSKHAFFRHYALKIIVTRKFPRRLLLCCAQYTVNAGNLRQTGGSCCHETEI